MDLDETEQTAAKILGETARCRFVDLARPFARGQLVEVAPSLDLVEVASAFHRDDSQRFAKWTDSGEVSRVSDDRAKAWSDRDPQLWAVVVAPWVLVQEREGLN